MSEQPPGGKPTYGSAVRVAQIVHWLHQFPFGISLADLADRLQVSQRTLARYMATLKEAFYDEDGPIIEVTRPGSGGRVRFRRKDAQAMGGTAYELMSLYMALDLMAFLEGTFLQEGAQGVLDRMQQSLQRQGGHQTNLVLKDFDRKFYHWREAPKDYSEHNAILRDLVEALVYQKKIKITYRSPGKEAKLHELNPLTMLMFKRGLYLVGLRDDQQRTFAVERIEKVTNLSQTFAYPIDYDPAERFQNTFGLVGDRDPVPIRLLFHTTVAANVGSRIWHPSQKKEITDSGSLLLTMDVDIGVELKAWVLGYGQYVKVLGPSSLRQDIKALLLASLNSYDQEDDGWSFEKN